ncbi:MAG: hypothetical protein EAZ57_05780 [Cytophagales bacterium]|nr:MAG: hypothetical protein EAZ67_06685 [Cytophagales bacterium]TAF60861.1 MAG: hypothetical protein EAZ57_05780 [Cytophagales bacterium]
MCCVVFVAMSCSKENSGPSDTQKPLIKIISPVEGFDSPSGVPVAISALVEDEELHALRVVVKQKSDGAILFEESPDVHGQKSYSLNTTYTATGLRRPVSARLTVIATDMSKNTDSLSVGFTINP